MKKSWGEARDEWLRKTSFKEEISLWAIDSIRSSEKEIYELETQFNSGTSTPQSNNLKDLKRNIKDQISIKENSLDDLSLNTPNTYKLQVSVPSSLNYLMKAWAAAEGRDLSSVALQCLEIGLREMKSNGSIPPVAVERYDLVCKKRVALAEVYNTWEAHELSLTK